MIHRRAAMAAAAGAAVSGALAAGSSARLASRGSRGKRRSDRGGRAPDTRPNFVFVVLDDMRGTDWSALGGVRDRLSPGSMFPNFVINCPLCSPSRVSLLTGLYAHNHGVFDNGRDDNDGGLEAFRRGKLENRTINYALERSGYHTGLVGKFLNGFREGSWRPAGWSRWVATTGLGYLDFTLNVDGEDINFRGSDYKTDVLRDYATEFVRSAPPERPLLLCFAPNAPHGPLTPARRHRNEFAGSMVRRDAAFNELDMSDKPLPMQAIPLLTAEEIAAIDQLERERLRALLAADEAILDIVRALEHAGRLDNTVIFVSSDNGFQLGQHRLDSLKGVPYDDSVRVPMLAWGAGFEVRNDERLVANVDIAPTVAGLAGVKFRRADGIDLLGRESRDFVPLKMPGNRRVPVGSGLRSPELVYMEYETGEREFYDRRVDPQEVANLLPPGSSFTEQSPAGLPPLWYLNARTRDLSRCVRRRCRT